MSSYRFWMAHTEKAIRNIIQTSVLCVDETCFLRPDHDYPYQYALIITLKLQLYKTTNLVYYINISRPKVFDQVNMHIIMKLTNHIRIYV